MEDGELDKAGGVPRIDELMMRHVALMLTGRTDLCVIRRG